MKTIAVVAIGVGFTSANAWYPTNPVWVEYYGFVATAKVGTTITCEGQWQMNNPIEMASLQCPHGKFARQDIPPTNAFELVGNGWELKNRQIIEDADSLTGRPILGSKRLIVQMKKVKVIKDFQLIGVGKMTKPN